MVKKASYDDIDFGENSVWNGAQFYSFEMIMKPLREIDMYFDLAEHGSFSLMEESQLDPETVKANRILGIKRLATTWEKLLSNTIIHMKKHDREICEKYLKQITKIKQNFHHLSTQMVLESGRSSVKINGKVFIAMYDFFQSINIPAKEAINKGGMIFPRTEMWDIDKVEQHERLMDEMINTG